MKFPCTIEKINTLKNGMKLIIAIDDKDVIEVMKHIYNFMNKPVNCDITVNEVIQKQRLNLMNDSQRKKVFALIKDIATETGENEEAQRRILQNHFCNEFIGMDPSEFSLSTLDKDTANSFLTYLVEIAFVMGVPLRENPKSAFTDDSYFHLCLKYKKCCICGIDGEIHHYQALGRGIDRKTYDDSDHRKIALCRIHHTESHYIGRDSFIQKYHITPILYNG